MAERLNAPVLKTGVPVRVPRVRIPLSPLLIVACDKRHGDKFVLKPKNVSWEETAQQLAAALGNWSNWEQLTDGWDGEQ